MYDVRYCLSVWNGFIDILGKNSIEMDDLINWWGNNNDKNEISNIYW